ncbi:MAG: NB-ARC domain-containing protein [Planctomycetaceae bacterium]
MFGQSIQSSWYFPSAIHTEAQNRLMYVAEQGEPFVLLQGTQGMGKTGLLRRVQDECRRFGHSCVLLNVAALDENAFLWHVCGGLSIAPRENATRSDMMTAIRDEITGRALCQHRTVLLLDDLNRAGDDLSLMVQFLISISHQTQGSLSVIASSDEHLSPQLRRLSSLRVELPRFSSDDSAAFVLGSLKAMNVDRRAISDDAIELAIEISDGLPARMSRICEMLKVAHTTDPDLRINSEVLALLTEETMISSL